MAAEDYSIRINVDSSSATQAQRNLQNLNSTVTQTERELNNTSSAARSAAASLSGLASVAKIAATSIAAISFRQAVQEMATFETKMLQLKALTMANETQMRSMEKQARVLGTTTAFSAQQAAEAMGTLASAGLKTNEIMQATPQILQLAAAGSLDLAKAAEIATGTMKALGLGISDLGRINDVFSTVAANSATSVLEVGEAMKNAAPLSRAFGVSLEMTAAAIGIAADNQIKGSEAGNNYKAMLSALGNDTKEHIEIVKKHGLTYSDLDVKTRGLDAVMMSLNKANLSGAEALKIFGSDAAAMGLIMANNAAKLKESEIALHGVTGAAEKQSDILNQGLLKAWDALKGSLTEAALQLGDNGVKGGLTDVIQAATGVISIYEGMGDEFAKSNKLTSEQYQNLKNVAGELRGMAGAVGGVAAVTAAIWGAEKAVLALNAVLAMNPLVRMGLIAGAATGYVHEKLADNQSTIDKQIETSEKRIAAMSKWGVQNMIGTAAEMLGAKHFDTEKERTKLTALKQYKEEQLELSKKQTDATVKETDAQKALDKKLQDVEAGRLKAQSGYESEPEKKKGASAAQKELNKQQEEYNRLLEKFKGEDPFEKYAQSMSDLYRVQKDLSPESFLLNQQKIAAEFEKSTVDLNAYNQELAKHKKYLEDITDYNATIDELTRNKQRGAITPTEYSLGVAQANAGLMNQVTDKKIPVNQAAEVIDAKNIDESAKALTKLDDLAKKTTDSFKQIGDSGKMAFDGLLGGISAVAAAATNFGDVMEKLNENHADYAKNYEKFMSDSTKSEEDKAKAKIGFEKENAAYQSASFKAEISGARQIAGATAKLFGEKSAARKAFHAIEMGMSVIEMAMAAKKMIVDVAAGAANMFSQGGFAGFAGVAAMAAVMAGLGFAMSGGSKTIGAIPEYTKTTGGVLGDSEAQSKSVENVSAKLDEIHAREYPELKNISSSMENFVKSIDKMLIVVARTGIDLQMINTKSGGFFGSTKVSTVGGGIKINEQSVADLQAGKEFDAQISSIIQTKKSGFLGIGSSTRITEMLSGLDKSIGDGLSHVITSMAKNVASFWEYLGLDMKKGMEAIGGFSFSAYIKTFGLKDSEITDALKNWTSMTYDQMITHVLGGFVKQFQAMGESIGDTLGRLVVDANSVKSSMRSAGMQVSLTGEDFVIFSQQMLDATGGLKNFISSMDTLINKFVSKDVKADISASNILDTLKTDAVTKAASDLKVDLTPFANFANDVKNNIPKTAEQISDMSVLAMKTVNDINTKFQDLSVANNRFQKSDYTTAKEQAFVHENPKITDKMIELFSQWGVSKSDTLADAEKKVGSKSGLWDTQFLPAIKYFNENAATKAKGESALAAMGLPIDLLQLQALESAAASAVDPAKELVTAITNISTSTADAAQKLDDDGKRIGASYESILKKITTPNETLIRNQKTVVDSLSDKLVSGGNELVNSKVIDWLKSIGETAVITEKTLQRYNDSLIEQEKALKKLSDSSKYLMEFSRSIDTWIRNLRATSLGTPESQLKASQANFGEQMKLAQFGATAEIKRQALSGITGYADTYINALKNYYASSEEGVNAIEQVIKEVSGLEKGLSIQELQLNELQSIKDAIDASTIEIPKGISLKSEVIFKDLIDQAKQIAIDTKANPTVENALRYDAYASIILTIDKSAKSGADSQFIDKLISSASGEKGLTANVGLIVDSAEFSASQKESIINGVMADFNKQINFNVSESFKSEVERVNNSWKQVELPTTKTDDAKTSVKGLTGGLTDLNGEYDVVITKTTEAGEKIVDFGNVASTTKFGLDSNSVSGTVASFDQITASANTAKAAMSDLSMADAAKLKVIPQQNLESQAVNAGYSGDYTDIAAMNSYISGGYDTTTTATDYQRAYASSLASKMVPEYIDSITAQSLIAQGRNTDAINGAINASAIADRVVQSMPEFKGVKFAKGGIAHTASIFGEAGAEAAVPLPDGRTIPVTLSRDSANDSGETIAELKEISRKQEIMINTLIAAAQENRKQNQALVTEIEGLRTDTRLKRAA